MSNKPNAIIYESNVAIDNHVHYRNIKEFINNSDIEYNTIYIVGIETITLDDMLNAISISLFANRVVFQVTPDNNSSKILRTLGFDVSETLEKYDSVSNQQDLDVIDSTCLSGNEVRIKGSLLSGMDTVLTAVEELVSFAKGDKGYFELAEETVKIGETIDIFTETIKDYLTNNVFVRDERLVSFVRYLSSRLIEARATSDNLTNEISSLRGTNEKYSETIKKLQNELDLLKDTVKFSHFVTYNVDKTKTEAKVIYIREYTHCPFLMTFLLNYRAFLAYNKLTNILVVVGQVKRDINVERLILNDRNILNCDVRQVLDESYIGVEEPSPSVWSFLFNNVGTDVVMVLDRSRSDVPALDVAKSAGINLNAIGSRQVIDNFNLDLKNTITSISKSSRNANYCIPIIDFEGRDDPQFRYNKYLSGCESIYSDIAKRIKVMR